MAAKAPTETPSRSGAVAYWALVVFLIGSGFLGILSIGFPFLLLGITLAILSQRRHETGVVVAGVSAIIGFTMGYILVAPLSCTMTESANLSGSHQAGAHTVCSNILGINYSGSGIYNPSLLPAFVAGLVVAVLFANGARWLARRLASRHLPPPPDPVVHDLGR